VRESLVGFGHTMRIFTLANGSAAVLRSFEQLVRKTESHGLLAAGTRGFDHPTHGERLATRSAHFDGHLIGGTTDATRLHFDDRLDVIESLREQRDGIATLLTGLLGDAIDCTIDDALSSRLLAALHDDVHELGEHVAVEFRVRQDMADGGLCTT